MLDKFWLILPNRLFLHALGNNKAVFLGFPAFGYCKPRAAILTPLQQRPLGDGRVVFLHPALGCSLGTYLLG